MYEAINMASTGLKNQQNRLDTIGNNISNVNTTGFKSSRLDFKDALYTAGFDPNPAYTEDGNLQKGHGVMTAGISMDYSDGNLQATENMLDFALEGDAFFEVSDSMGRRLYTRSGTFYVSTAGDGSMQFVTSQGHYVQDAAGNTIDIPEGATDIEVSPQGLMVFIGGEEELGSVQLGVYTFSNRGGLSAVGDSNYETTVASGEKITADANDYRVNQGFIESSNVDLANEMTLLIRTQRAFQLASRALTTADDMEGIANNMRR